MPRRTDGTPPVEKNFLTTTEAARLCQVARRTMIRWVDAEKVPHHRTPGGRARILRTDLAAFLREQGMPVPVELDDAPIRIAIVDDDRQIVAALTRLVERVLSDADIRSARDGFTAGLLLSSFRPQLLLLDLSMPGMDGYEVLRRIRLQSELDAMAVVVVTGLADPDVERLRSLGAQEVLSKPVHPRDLQPILRRLGPGVLDHA